MSDRRRKLAIGNWPLVALLLVGLFVFTFRITHESLWMDEAFSIAITDHSFGELWRLSLQENHPPLYYFMLWAFRLVFGDSILAARLFSAVGAFCLILLGIGPIQRACGKKMAVVYTVVAIFTPNLVVYAQEIRMYVWAAFFVAGMAVYAHLAISEGRRSDWVKFGVLTAAAMYAHLYSLLAAFFIGLFSLVWLLLRGRKKLPVFLVAAGVPVLLFVPWLSVLFRRTSQVSQDFWIPEVTDKVIVQVLCSPFGLKFYHDDPLFQVVTAVAFLVIVGGVVVAFVKKQPDRFLPALALFTFSATFLAALLLSRLVRPLLIPRYMVPLLGLFICALAYGISRFPKWPAVIVCVLFVLSQAGTIYFIHWERFNGPMDEVAGYLEGNMGEDDVFVHFDEHTLHTFAVYIPDHLHVMYLPPDSKVYASPEVHGARVKIVADLSELALENRRVWLVMRIDGGNVQNYDRVARELGVEPVPTSPERLYEAMHAEGAEFFGLPNSWYAVVLQPVDLRP